MTSEDTRAGSITIRLPFNNSISKAERILVEIGESHPLIIKTEILPCEYAEYCLMLMFSFSTKTSEFWKVWSDVIHLIEERFEQEKIEIALPPG